MRKDIFDKVLEIFLILSIILVALTGQNKLIYGYKVLIILFAAIPFFLINSKKINIYFNKENIIWLVMFLFFTLSVIYTIDMKQTLYFLVIYMCGISFVYHKFNNEFWDKLLNVLEIFTIICALTILLEKFLPSVFGFLFGWFGNEVSVQYDSSLKGYFSGILFEGARAAFTMNIGIAIVYANILLGKGNKSSNIFKMILLFVALLLTGKRMLTVIGVGLTVAIFIISNKNKKAYKKFWGAICVVMILTMLVSIIVPDIIKPFRRMLNMDGSIGGRKTIWLTCIDMFVESPIMGKGIGSFNKYLEQTGFTFWGKAWTSHAHNSYLQILAETGCIGILLMLAAMIYTLIKNFIIIIELKNKNLVIDSKVITAFYIQLLFIIYALTGNPFHNFSELYIYLIFVNFIIQKTKKEMCENKDE